MLIKQWKRTQKARKAIFRRAKQWGSLEPISSILASYNHNTVIHHVGRYY